MESLVIFFAKCKTNQEGVDKNVPWHIHANPNDPSICPVHALSIYLFTNPHLLSAESRIFPGESQYRHYSKILMKRIDEHQEVLATYGCCDNLGSHSIRKGSASYAASGSTVAPSIVSICMRAGWTISGAKERYLKFENAGDSFVSRIGSGLNPTCHEFAISPAYFEFQDEGEEQMLALFMQEMFRDVVDIHIHGMVRMMLASVCYSYDWFVNTIHANNPFRSSVLFANLTNNITSLARTSFPWNRTARTPAFTGIPPHVGILNMLEALKQGQASLQDGIVRELVKELDERGTLGGFNANRMRDIMNEAIGGVRDEIRTIRATGAAQLVPGGGGEVEVAGPRQHTLHYYNGQYHMLPQGWEYPRGMNLKAVFHLYLIGNRVHKVPPFAIIKNCKDVKHLKRGRKTLDGMRYLMKHAKRGLELDGRGDLYMDDVWDWNVTKVNAFYSAVLCKFKYGKHNRDFEGLSWLTLLRDLYNRKGKLFGEVEGEGAAV